MLMLNCDLGESYGSWKMGRDDEVMPHIDQANIACGFHGGDPLVMEKTLAMAKQNDVMVGAHPAYPDLVGFGRRPMQCSADEISAFMHYQIAALEGMAKIQGLELAYVKPHGALYNDMMARDAVRAPIMKAIADFHMPVRLMLQATPQAEQHRNEAADHGIDLWFEAFADRCYDDDGKLLLRAKPGAVHSREKMLAQVEQICRQGRVTSVSGHSLELKPDTLCVHGDNDEGIAAIKEIRKIIHAYAAMKKIETAGQNAFIVYFGEQASAAVSAQIQAAVSNIYASMAGCIVDLVPSYASLLVIFDLDRGEPFAVRRLLRAALTDLDAVGASAGELVTLPVYYSLESGPDLEVIAERGNIGVDDVIEIHQQQEYRVYAIGFAPGFAYLGEVDERIAAPRLSTPRQKVPRGAVAIADRQTAVYPAVSPGGWNLIGLCPTRMFDPERDPSMPVRAGDRVRFEAITREQFLAQGGEL